MNSKRKQLITEAETKKAEQNKVGEEIARLKRNKEDASGLLAKMQTTAGQVKELEQKAAACDEEIQNFALVLPNKLHSSVPIGETAEDNQVVKTVGVTKQFSFKAKEHWELGEKLGLLDFERAGKVAGARFAFLRGGLAKLERGLIQFMMDLHSTQHGYEEMIPPYIVNSPPQASWARDSFREFRDDVFHLANTDYYLIPTAEVPVTNFFAEEILRERSDLCRSSSPRIRRAFVRKPAITVKTRAAWSVSISSTKSNS